MTRLPHRLRLATVAATSLILVAACSGSSGSESHTYVSVDELPDPIGDLDLDDLPEAPDGFTSNDVENLAERVVELTERGLLDQDVQMLSPEDATTAVLEVVPPESAEGFGGQVADSGTYTSVSFPVATKEPASIEFIRQEWHVETYDLESSGTPVLKVSLGTTWTAQFDDSPIPIIGARVMSMSSSDPARIDSGGPAPGVGARALVAQTDICAFSQDHQYKPFSEKRWNAYLAASQDFEQDSALELMLTGDYFDTAAADDAVTGDGWTPEEIEVLGCDPG